MVAANATRLLDIWEQGQRQSPVQRALSLLHNVMTPGEQGVGSTLPIGERDRRLLLLREQLFGTDMQCTVHCPACNEQLEFVCQTRDLQDGNSSAMAPGINSHALSYGGFIMRFRLPNSLDLLQLENSANLVDRQMQLLSRCLLEIKTEDQTAADTAADVSQLPQAVMDEVIASMAAKDPQAQVSLDMHCPNCEHVWQSQFDIVSYLWSEIDAWAKRTFNEIHVLASTYGWAEQAILSMSAWRRRYYLSMIYQ